jgi:hypothetical protein
MKAEDHACHLLKRFLRFIEALAGGLNARYILCGSGKEHLLVSLIEVAKDGLSALLSTIATLCAIQAWLLVTELERRREVPTPGTRSGPEALPMIPSASRAWVLSWSVYREFSSWYVLH